MLVRLSGKFSLIRARSFHRVSDGYVRSKFSRLSTAAKTISDSKDVLTDLQQMIDFNGNVFRIECPLSFGIINRFLEPPVIIFGENSGKMQRKVYYD